MRHNKTTNRQEQFLREYLECGVAAEAYVDVGDPEDDVPF